ncbi:MAG: class I SAM-dependent methyltransferase [Spirochaetes bacterium]|nr:class I SAM-dependent methyltransferase [Spirochaetota bacterium]
MTSIKHRIPEGEAINDSMEITMEQYSEIMKKQLGKEYEKFSDNIIKRIKPGKNFKILEIGPGPGWAGISLLKKRPDLVLEGLEASSDMIRVAGKNADREGVSARCSYKNGVVEDMRTLNSSVYDLVISRDSMHHWTDPEKAFSEIKRVLKPEGKLYIHDSRRDMNLFGKLIVNISSRFIPNNMGKYWKSSIAASYTPKEIEELLNRIKYDKWSVSSDFMDLQITKI